MEVLQFGSLNLLDATAQFREQGWTLQYTVDTDRLVFGIPLVFTGPSADAAEDNYRAVAATLRQAVRAARRQSLADLLALTVGQQTTTPLDFPVMAGTLDRPASRYAAGFPFRATLTLECLPEGLGAPVTVSLGTIQNGQAAAVYLASVAGDERALVTEVRAVDQSLNGKVAQRLRIGVATGMGASSTDFAPRTDATAAGSGTSSTDATAIGGAVARGTLTPGADFVTLARAVQPSVPLNAGLFDAWLRVKDNAAPLAQPSALSGAFLGQVFRIIQVATDPEGISTTTTRTPVWLQSTIDGNTLLLIVKWNNDAAPPTVTAPDGWILLASVNASTASVPAVAVYIQENAPAQSGAVTVTWSTAVAYKSAVLLEVDGLAVANTLHAASSSTTATGQLPFTDPAGQTIPLAVEQEFVLYVVGANAAPGTGSTTTPRLNEYSGWNQGSELADVNSLGVAWRQATTSTVAGAPNALPGVTVALNASPSTITSIVKLGLAFLPDEANPDYTLRHATFQLQVRPIDIANTPGNASGIITVSVPVNNGAILLNWGSVPGSISHWEIGWERGEGWRSIVTTDAATSFTLTTEDGATLMAGPFPTSGASATPSRVRAVAGLSSGLTVEREDGVACGAAGAQRLVNLGPLQLGAEVGGVDYLSGVDVQARNGGGPSNTVDIDALFWFPHDAPQLTVEWPTLDLAVKRTWVVATRADGRVAAVLLDSSTSAEQGRPRITRAPLEIGPGPTLLPVTIDTAGGVSDVTGDVRVALTLTYRSRFHWQKGAAS